MEHPERLLPMLAQRWPSYQRYLTPPAPPAPAAPPPLPNLEDYSIDMGNGQRTFSYEGLQKFVDATVQSALAKTQETLKPLLSKAEAEAALRKKHEEIAPLVHFAKQFPGFKENEAEILALVQKEPITLQQAYERVVWNKRIADESAMREKLLKELKAAPPAATSSATAATPATPPTLDQVIGGNIDKASAAA
jgi:hypothetical protein